MNKGFAIRPTSDKSRGAVFSSLGSLVSGAKFLDICAGTGAMGLEALSRGAVKAVAIEKSREAAQLIVHNMRQLGVLEQELQLIIGEFASVLPRLAPEKFEIIFADPPYGKGHPREILFLVEQYGLLNLGGILVIEHFAKELLPNELGRLYQIKAKHYGQTTMSYFALQQANAQEVF